jgi:hypothetical protein
LQNHLPHLAYSHSNSRTRAFLDSTDRKWIYAEYNMTAQQTFKTVPSAITLEQCDLTDTKFDPP